MYRISLSCILLLFIWTFIAAVSTQELEEPPTVILGAQQLYFTKLDTGGYLPVKFSHAVSYPVTVTFNFSNGGNESLTFEPGFTSQSLTFPIENEFSLTNLHFSINIQSISNGTIGNISYTDVFVQYRSLAYLSGSLTVTSPQVYFANVTLSWPAEVDTHVNFTVVTPGDVNLTDFGYIMFNETSVTVPAGETYATFSFTYGPSYTGSGLLPNLTLYLTGSDVADLTNDTQGFDVYLPIPSVQVLAPSHMWMLSNEGQLVIPLAVQPTFWEDDVIQYKLYDQATNSSVIDSSSISAGQNYTEIAIPLSAGDTTQPDRMWLITLIPSSSYGLVGINPSVNVTIVDEVVYFNRDYFVATSDGVLPLDFILLYPSTIDVSVKFTISDDTGVLNTSYATLSAGQQNVTWDFMLPPNTQPFNLSYLVAIENALNSTIGNSPMYPSEARIQQLTSFVPPPTDAPTFPPTPTPIPSNSSNDTSPTSSPTPSPNPSNSSNDTLPTKPPTSFPTNFPTDAPTVSPTPLPSLTVDDSEPSHHRRNVIIGSVIGGFFGLLIVVALIIVIVALIQKKAGKGTIGLETFGIKRG